MARHRATAAILAAALLAAGCALPGPPAGTATVDESYTLAAGTFSTGGGLALAVGVREAEGRVAVCGAWRQGPQSVRSIRYNDDVLSSGIVRLGGVRLVQGLGFMTRHPVSSRLGGRRAACVLTGTPWSAEAAAAPVAVTLPRRQFEHDDSEEGGSTAAIRFRQTPPPAGVL